MAKVKSTAQKVTQRIDVIDNIGFFVKKYDFDNKYPQRVTDIVNDSGTAKTCLKLYEKFVFGGGLKDTDFYKSKINSKGETTDKFVRKLVKDFGKFGGVAIHVNYNGLYQKREVSLIPFEFCRLVPEGDERYGMIEVYDDWGMTKHKKFDKTDIVYINPYNPANVEQEVEDAGGWENYKGQIYYSPMNEYPLAPFDAVLEDMLTEGQLKKFKHSTATDNFLASHLLVMGKTESDEDAELFDENMRAFQGGEGAGRIMVIERESNEEAIELKKLDIQNYDGLYEYTENSSRDAIIKMFLIPPVLLLRVQGSLGTSKEISDAFDYYNGITSDDRLVVEEILTEIFSNFYYNICPSNDYSILPLKYSKAIAPEYLSYYTKNEIRIANGDEEATDLKADTTLLAVTLGVGGTQALTSILSDPLLTIDQKKGTLKVLFGLSEEQTNQMLTL